MEFFSPGFHNNGPQNDFKKPPLSKKKKRRFKKPGKKICPLQKNLKK